MTPTPAQKVHIDPTGRSDETRSALRFCPGHRMRSRERRPHFREIPTKVRIIISFVVVFLLATGITRSTEGPALSGGWDSFGFLIGKWAGLGSGSPGAGSGFFTFAFDLDSTILVRKNHTEYPPKPGEHAGIVHDDMMIIYRNADTSGFRAIYFDNEGHVIDYLISVSPRGTSVTFDSEADPGKTRYRLHYVLEPSGILTVEFSIGLPGSEFKTYLRGSAVKAASEN